MVTRGALGNHRLGRLGRPSNEALDPHPPCQIRYLASSPGDSHLWIAQQAPKSLRGRSPFAYHTVVGQVAKGRHRTSNCLDSNGSGGQHEDEDTSIAQNPFDAQCLPAHMSTWTLPLGAFQPIRFLHLGLGSSLVGACKGLGETSIQWQFQMKALLGYQSTPMVMAIPDIMSLLGGVTEESLMWACYRLPVGIVAIHSLSCRQSISEFLVVLMCFSFILCNGCLPQHHWGHLGRCFCRRLFCSLFMDVLLSTSCQFPWHMICPEVFQASPMADALSPLQFSFCGGCFALASLWCQWINLLLRSHQFLWRMLCRRGCMGLPLADALLPTVLP